MRNVIALCSALSLAVSSNAFGVILLDSPLRNTAAPAGVWAGDAWSLQGRFGLFLGTPVGPRHFLTAQHIGQNVVGTNFTLGTQRFVATDFVDLPGSDLRLVEVSQPFSSWASLWDPRVDGNETGRELIVFVRSPGRGDEIFAPTSSTNLLVEKTPPVQSTGVAEPAYRGELNGWSIGEYDGVMSWGTNRVDQIVEAEGFGDVISFNLSRGASRTEFEAVLAGGDSGGAVFVRNDAGEWKLAGINLAVDGRFSAVPDGPFIDAALFDMGGYYVGSEEASVYVPDMQTDVAQSSYASRIAPLISKIESIAQRRSVVAEPAAGLFVLAMWTLGVRRVRISFSQS